MMRKVLLSLAPIFIHSLWLYALFMSPAVPLWIVAVGIAFAVFMAKEVTSRLDSPSEIEFVPGQYVQVVAPPYGDIYERSTFPDKTIWYFYGARTTRDMFYLDELRELKRSGSDFRLDHETMKKLLE